MKSEHYGSPIAGLRDIHGRKVELTVHKIKKPYGTRWEVRYKREDWYIGYTVCGEFIAEFTKMNSLNARCFAIRNFNAFTTLNQEIFFQTEKEAETFKEWLESLVVINTLAGKI